MPEADIEILTGFFRGKRRQDFVDAMHTLRESLELGGWLSRGEQRLDKGLGKGIAPYKSIVQHNGTLFPVYMAAAHGWDKQPKTFDAATDEQLLAVAPKVPLAIFRAWLRLLAAVHVARGDLNASRPLPTYTEIGLSPKVTATLLDATIDLDLTTRKLCPLGWRWGKTINKYGQEITRKIYFADWPKGTRFGSSRFAHCDCQACGKTIPSGLTVPVLVSDSSGTVHGFWFGRDCAANILGIKDAGIVAPKK